MRAPDVTAFGSRLASPNQAAAVLRARAASAGLPLRPAETEDLCAAVLAAHCWAVSTRRSSLTQTMDAATAGALAPALARAAGHSACPTDVGDHPGQVRELPPSTLSAMEPVVRWALAHGGPEALLRAAADLSGVAVPAVAACADHLLARAGDFPAVQ